MISAPTNAIKQRNSGSAGPRCGLRHRRERFRRVDVMRRDYMPKPFVTALIDTYNHEAFIEKAITSVLEQNFPGAETEVLVVDDGSTDRTPAP
jgi:cellulose synthase/poly-beta-1,6-N-acetylglucosamine synthase-like glycosyltransferase